MESNNNKQVESTVDVGLQVYTKLRCLQSRYRDAASSLALSALATILMSVINLLVAMAPLHLSDTITINVLISLLAGGGICVVSSFSILTSLPRIKGTQLDTYQIKASMYSALVSNISLWFWGVGITIHIAFNSDYFMAQLGYLLTSIQITSAILVLTSFVLLVKAPSNKEVNKYRYEYLGALE